MSRSFLLAGSRSVVVSLWQVPSLETVDIMTSFYKHILSGKKKNEALRMAKLDLIEGGSLIGVKDDEERGIKLKKRKQTKKQRHHPYYWAPFILVGK